MQILHYLGMEIQHIEERGFESARSPFRQSSPLHDYGKSQTGNREECQNRVEYSAEKVPESAKISSRPMSPYVNGEEYPT